MPRFSVLLYFFLNNLSPKNYNLLRKIVFLTKIEVFILKFTPRELKTYSKTYGGLRYLKKNLKFGIYFIVFQKFIMEQKSKKNYRLRFNTCNYPYCGSLSTPTCDGWFRDSHLERPANQSAI
jgi:hypothetical protein